MHHSTAAAAAPPCTIEPPAQCPWYNATLALARRRDLLLAAMTPDEKLEILAGRGCERLHVRADGFNEAAHGIAWAGRATVFPCSIGMAATWDPPLVREMGRAVAHEGLAKHWRQGSTALSFFAPNVNIVRDIRWGRAQETYGEDPTLTAVLAAAYVSGMQDPNRTGVLAVRSVAKHFAAYNLESDFAVGGVDGQFRLSYDANVSHADLLQTFLPAWEALVDEAAVRGAMCAYNSLNGTPLCAHPLLHEQLRGKLRFDGLLVTDCGAIGYMVSTHKWRRPDGRRVNITEAAAATLAAGVDANCGSTYGEQLPLALRLGLITPAMVDRAVARVLYGWLELGLLHDAAAAAADGRRHVPLSVVDGREHRALAKQAAAQSVVLLKNDGSLPLGGGAAPPLGGGAARRGARRLAVVGPNANRTLSLTSNYAGCKDRPGGPILAECSFVNPLQGLAAAARAAEGWEDEVAYARGCDIDTRDGSEIARAVEAARHAEVVVFVGGLITCQEIGAECQEAEARDRSSPVGVGTDVGKDVGVGLLRVHVDHAPFTPQPGRQLDVLQAIANSTHATIVLVIMSGSAVATPWAAASDRVGAIVQHFYAGVLGGEALAEVLFGQVAPSGRLPVMVPTSEAQLPAAYLDQSMQAPPGRTHRYFTGVPLYPFGFGLGYSTFQYSDLQTSHHILNRGDASVSTLLILSVLVRNNGEFTAGPSDEVVMVFCRPRSAEGASVPRQMLLGFTRVSIAPHQVVKAEVQVPAKRLRMVGLDGKFELLRGEYELIVGLPAGQGVGVPQAISGKGSALHDILYVR